MNLIYAPALHQIANRLIGAMHTSVLVLPIIGPLGPLCVHCTNQFTDVYCRENTHKEQQREIQWTSLAHGAGFGVL